jgi:alpha-glucosidase
MQWDESANAGFTTGTPWLPVPPTYKTVNVKMEQGQPDSLLTWYQKLIELKKTHPAFAEGSNLMLDQDNAKVLSWLRQTADGKQVLVSCNFTADPQTVNLSGGGLKGTKAKTLLKSPNGSEPGSLDKVDLPAFGVWIGEVQ